MFKEIHVQSRAVIIDREQILLCRTVALTPNFYFLPGGHIEHMESAEKALLRELREEIGFEFYIKRFLGCLEYSANPSHAKCHNHEYSFIFEVSSIECKANQPITQLENHIELHWIPLSQLKTIDFRPDPLKVIITTWLEKDLNVAFKSKMI